LLIPPIALPLIRQGARRGNIIPGFLLEDCLVFGALKPRDIVELN